jgi:Skp family chaperone for outer membrane proteins
MRRISVLAFSLVCIGLFSIAAFAQPGAGTPKIGWIDTGAFGDEKEGVTKYINALKALDSEMKPKVTELQGMQTRIQNLAKEIDTLQQTNSAVPVNQATIQSKQEEGQKLQREFEFKKKEYDAAVETRSGAVLGPVSADISKAIQEYAKAKGYAVILDINALAQASAILALDNTANITKDFIAFYNARPATTASATTPK